MEEKRMYNSITLIGNLGADPDIKQTSKGGNYALLSIATHKKIKGEKLTEWHKVVVWDEKIAEVLQKYTRKGSKVLLQGRLTYKTWDKEGIQMKQAEVHLDRFESKMEMLDSKSESKSSQNEMDDFGSDKTYENETNEDVPF